MTMQLVTGSIMGLLCMGMAGECIYVAYRWFTRKKS
jgi:hypothetical protein